MAINFGFFDAEESGGVYDRLYSASNFCDYLGSIICNGVQKSYGDALSVSITGNYTVSVATGKAWLDGHYLVNDEATEIDTEGIIEPAANYFGYAIVCAYYDEENRECGLTAVSGNTVSQYEDTGPALPDSYVADDDGITYTCDGIRYIPIAGVRIAPPFNYISGGIDMRSDRYMRCILGACPNGLDIIDQYADSLAEVQAQLESLQEEVQAELESLQEEISLATTILTEEVGDNVTASLAVNGRITVTGSGDTTTALSSDFVTAAVDIWADLSDTPVISVGDGVTSLCDSFFERIGQYWMTSGFSNLPATDIPATVTVIGERALCSIDTNYAGTMAEWQAIEMPTDVTVYATWDAGVTDFYVICTDGKLKYVSTNQWEEVTDD